MNAVHTTTPARKTADIDTTTANRAARYRAVLASAFVKDAWRISVAIDELLARMTRFVETHDADAIERVLRRAGVASNSECFRRLAANVLQDVSGARYGLELAGSMISSELPGEPEDAPNPVARRKPR
jgi:hypothetical protein